MPIVRLNSLSDPRLAPYAALTERQLRNRLNPEEAIFVAESPKVILTALSAGLRPISLLCEERHIQGDAMPIVESHPHMPVFVGERQLLSQLTGYELTRGVLCAMQRPPSVPAADICKNARRIAVLQSITDTTNIGAIFRSAAALGIDAVLLTPDTCDPLNRRAVRVSMGSVFLVPWAWLETTKPVDELHTLGFKTVAMALTERSLAIDHPALCREEHLAIILGTEGDGLPAETIAASDYVVRIPMHHGVDSLNVAAASALAFWELTK